MLTERQRYRQHLLQTQTPAGIPSSKGSDIRKVAPHLSPADAYEIVRRAQVDGDQIFVGPPLRVQGALHVFQCGAEFQRTIFVRLHITYVRAARRLVSYVGNPPPLATHLTYPHEEQAQNFASNNWPEELAWDESKSVMYGAVVPTHSAWEFPPPSTCIAWIRQGFPEVFGSRWKPDGELLNDAIIGHEWGASEAAEMLGAHLPFLANFCGYCGAGIADENGYRQTICVVCHQALQYHLITEGGANVCAAIPRRTVEDMPGQFNQSPEIAWLRDYEDWIIGLRASVTKQVSKDTPVKYHRVIELDPDDE